MSAALVLALLLAVLIGVSLAVLGSGGSIITMPVLVYVAGIPAHTAVGMSLVIVGTTAAAGSYLQSRSGGFHRRAAAIFAATGAAGAYAGARLTHLVAGDTLMAIFAGLMLLAGWRMLAPPAPDAGEQIEMVPPSQIKGKVNDTLEKEHERTLNPKVE